MLRPSLAATTQNSSHPGSPLSQSTHLTESESQYAMAPVTAIVQHPYNAPYSNPSGARYSGTPEVQDAGGPRITTPPSPDYRFSGYSESSSVNHGGGFYYNTPRPLPPGAGAPGVSNFTSQQQKNFHDNMDNQSPISQKFPSTPLTANSEQGLLAYAQAEGSSSAAGSPQIRKTFSLPPVIIEGKAKFGEKGTQW